MNKGSEIASPSSMPIKKENKQERKERNHTRATILFLKSKSITLVKVPTIVDTLQSLLLIITLPEAGK